MSKQSQEPIHQIWFNVATAPEGIVVNTKIDDSDGCRNEQQLKRHGNLWYFPDMSMYVYYRPTHWKPVIDGEVKA